MVDCPISPLARCEFKTSPEVVPVKLPEAAVAIGVPAQVFAQRITGEVIG